MGLAGAAVGGAAISGVAGLGGSLISGSAAKSAAGVQADAARQAAQLQAQQFETTRNDLQPYNLAGQGVLDPMTAYLRKSAATLGGAADLAQANLPGNMTQAQLLQTPGYQFAVDQGMKAVQNSQASKGLGMSGSGIRAGTNFATGLANQTYKDQFGIQQQRYLDYVQNFQNQAAINSQVFGQYGTLANLGENAAAKSGAIGQAGAAAAGTNIANAGTALGAGIAGQGGALGAGLSNLGNTASSGLQNYAMAPYLQSILTKLGGGGTSPVGTYNAQTGMPQTADPINS